MTAMRKAVAVVLAVLCLVLGWTAGHYREKAGDFEKQLVALKAQVAQQTKDAETRYATLKRERDEKQAKLDTLYVTQEQKDAAAKKQITGLTAGLVQRPVRVRLEPQAGTGGGSGGSTPGATTTDSNAGEGGRTQAYGLLPESNTRRLVDVIEEVEVMSAAYASCRERLLAH